MAFANGEGGCIVFGIENQTLRVVGVPDDQVFTIMDAISNAIADSCEPLIIPDISMRDIDGKTVIVAEILPGAQRPYFVRSMGREQGHVRPGRRYHTAGGCRHHQGTIVRGQQQELRPGC